MISAAQVRVLSALALLGLVGSSASAQKFDLEQLGREALKTVAVGAAVDSNAGAINKFINTVTARRGWKDTQTTKVVPILSLGDKGYIGAAQVSGPASALSSVRVVWQVEGSKQIGDGIYRIKALIPSNSLSPLEIRRVQKVGITALIDTATGGAAAAAPGSKGLMGGDLLKAGVIAVAVKASASQLNTAINSVTGNRPALATRVVPALSLGERAYIGAAQLTGSTTTIGKVQAVGIYDDSFDRGRYRVRIVIPATGSDPTRLKRVPGVGLAALVETTINRVERPVQSKVPTLSLEKPRVPAPRTGSIPPVPASNNSGGFVPPGLAKKGGVPPGLAKKGGLPPGQAKKHRDDDEEHGRGKGKHKDHD
nr:hypothetical protein [Armatimonas sp.]